MRHLRAAALLSAMALPAVAADKDEAALARACAALEMLHASALVHDDYMDASDTRRGRPATHRAFESEHRAAGWSGDPEQYGAAAAILPNAIAPTPDLAFAYQLMEMLAIPVFVLERR